MSRRDASAWIIVFLFLGVSLAGSGARAAQAGTSDAATLDQQPPIPPEELPAGSDVLTRGPVNEAFAEPVPLEPQEGLVAPNEPPAPIQEVPPDERPQDDRAVWVPGYWSWDADRNDFIWVSACWRIAPPNMYWVPGYWTRVAGGWQWIPGFWARAGALEVQYLPSPPASVDLEPPGPPPSPDNVWVPGCWYWTRGQYVRRPGYWLREQPGWVWVPSHFRWTPRGYVFVGGHWDYALADRGVLFAPVYFPPTVYARVGFSFSPSIAIEIGVLVGNLFTYPRYGHYYFGDYYDDSYVKVGIYPWFECERVHTWYDPIYVHDRWRHERTDPHWAERERQDYDRRRADRDLRPPRTYREMEVRVARLPEPSRREAQLAVPLRTLVQTKATPLRFKPIDNGARMKIASGGSQVRKFREARAKWEAPAPGAAPAAPAPPPAARPGERRGQAARSEAEGGPAKAAIPETKGRTAVTETRPPAVAPRETRPTRPERVRIPAPPVVGKTTAASGKSRNAPPPQPSSERKTQTERPKEKQKPKRAD